MRFCIHEHNIENVKDNNRAREVTGFGKQFVFLGIYLD
jgi:hypothetical protein